MSTIKPEQAAGDDVVPDHATTVVVPIANPETAIELLRLARAVIRADGGRLIALVVVLGEADAEENLERSEAVEAMVDTLRARDGRVKMEVITRPAGSIARGILDTTRDEDADLVVLGVQAPTRGDVVIGGITEQVIKAAECDVMIYRQGCKTGIDEVNAVVVGIDEAPSARTAARLGIILGQGLALPIEMLHVHGLEQFQGDAFHIMAVALDGLDGETHCPRHMVRAESPVEGLCSHATPESLVVLGFQVDANAPELRIGTTVLGALDSLEGPVVAVSRLRKDQGVKAGVRRLAKAVRPRLTSAEERSLIWHARVAATTDADFIVLCVVAAAIATLGLLLNSAAVIIGAMLVAPLMGPIVSFGTSLVDGDVPTLRRAAGTTGLGVLLVAGVAVLIGVMAGGQAATAEMLSRGSPTLLDAGVAAASGVIGGYASARRGIPAALAGVAIAAALVPPICVFGLSLTIDARLAAGAALLFITNIACIAIAGAAILLWLGVRARTPEARRRLHLSAPVLAMVLGAVILFGLSTRGPDLAAVQRVVAQEIPDVEVVGADDAGPAGTVTVTVRSAGPPDQAGVNRAVDRVRAEEDARLRIAVQTLVE